MLAKFQDNNSKMAMAIKLYFLVLTLLDDLPSIGFIVFPLRVTVDRSGYIIVWRHCSCAGRNIPAARARAQLVFTAGLDLACAHGHLILYRFGCSFSSNWSNNTQGFAHISRWLYTIFFNKALEMPLQYYYFCEEIQKEP